METEKLYSDFLEKYKNYPLELAMVAQQEKENLPKTNEDQNYNLGTMEKDLDIRLSQNIVVANAYGFKSAYTTYKNDNPGMPDDEAKARVVFDFLQAHGTDFSYDEHKNDVLFGNVTREQFYAGSVYKNVLSNTNFFHRHIGDMQMLCLEPKSFDSFPRGIGGLAPETLERFSAIPAAERFEILHKRGLYHESLHMATGTADERKCDAFALLKIMKEHPTQAQTVFELYNMQRSKIGYVVDNMHGKEEGTNAHQRAIKGGAMTYMMPKTYQKLAGFAHNPEQIPNGDAALLKLTYELTSEVEFSHDQLKDFGRLMNKKNITSADLAQDEIVQSCMQQGGFEDINTYIKSDPRLKLFMEQQEKNNSVEIDQKIEKIRKKLRNLTTEEWLKPPQDLSKVDFSALKLYQSTKSAAK